MTRNRCLIFLGAVLIAVCLLWRPAEPPSVRPVPVPPGKEVLSEPIKSIPDPYDVASSEEADIPQTIVLSGPLPAPNPPSKTRQVPAVPFVPAAQKFPVAEPEAVPDVPQRELESLALNIRQYQLRFGGNPVGTNAEIVRELNGGNLKGAEYLPSNLRRLNDQGELLDNWGTPYFFHQEAADRMEIRSAGADAVMWTADDIVTR